MLLLNNPFLDPDAIIRELQALNKKGVRNGITPLEMTKKNQRLILSKSKSTSHRQRRSLRKIISSRL